MSRLRWLAILMAAVILIIAGFQVYWLRDNYNRASHELETKTGLLFRETYREVQDSLVKLRIQRVFGDTLSGTFQMTSSSPVSNNTARVISMLSSGSLRDSLRATPRDVGLTLKKREDPYRIEHSKLKEVLDSIKPENVRKVNIYHRSELDVKADSVITARPLDIEVAARRRPAGAKRDSARTNFYSQINTLYLSDDQNNRVVIRLDSLVNDSVQVKELNSRFTQTLAREKIPVPFKILRQVEGPDEALDASGPRWMTLERNAGLYKLQLGKVYPFLLKQLSLPILFSVFLVGITLFSFVLMYRSLRHQHRLAQLKSDLISNITHELKTPIATVGVAIEALKSFNAIQDPARTREYLDISQHELQRLGLLVDKVLKLSMFEKKEVEIQRQSFNLGDVVDEVVASLRLQLEKYQARITVEKEGDLQLVGDRLHLQSVVFNLLDNALKYSKGNAAIDVHLHSTDTHLVLKVTDNGIGIPPAYHQKIFEKFFRVPAGDTHNAKGHGLGLSYVAQVVQQHGGTVEMDSHEGLGSTFTISLPKSSNGNTSVS